MRGHRVSADDEKSRVFLQEATKEVDEVFVQSTPGVPRRRTRTGQVARGVASGIPEAAQASRVRDHTIPILSSGVV